LQVKDSRTSKNRSNKAWIRRHLDDPYVQAANREGYRSRAAYKLIEIDDRDRLIRAPATVVELGAAPGSWTQVLVQRLADRAGQVRGRVIAVDRADRGRAGHRGRFSRGIGRTQPGRGSTGPAGGPDRL
jgi:hypothetical protein